MTTMPRDLTDLYLAPVALDLDRRLEGMTGRTPHQLDLDVAMATDQQPRDAYDRRALLLATLTHLLPTHGWHVAWHPRGLAVTHGQHLFVLGVPDSVREYLAD